MRTIQLLGEAIIVAAGFIALFGALYVFIAPFTWVAS